MKRVIAAIAAIFLFAASHVAAQDWVKIAEKVSAASFPLKSVDSRTFCTGFVVDKDDDYALTAAHCVDSEFISRAGLLVDKKPVEIVDAGDPYGLDVAVLKLTNDSRPDLEAYKGELRVGMPWASYGNARESGLYEHFRVGIIAAVSSVDSLDGLWVISDQPISGGMSGGPVVTGNGKVISMNQRSDRRFSALGRTIHEIYQHTRQYWRK